MIIYSISIFNGLNLKSFDNTKIKEILLKMYNNFSFNFFCNTVMRHILITDLF